MIRVVAVRSLVRGGWEEFYLEDRWDDSIHVKLSC